MHWDFLQLFGGGGGGPTRAVGEDFSVGKLAAGVSSWWAALDPTAVLADAPSPAQSAASPVRVACASKALGGPRRPEALP